MVKPTGDSNSLHGAQGLNFGETEPLTKNSGVQRSAQGVFGQQVKAPKRNLFHRVKLFNELGLKFKLFGAKIACIFLKMRGKEIKERGDCKTFEDFKSNPVLYIKLKEWMKSTHSEENLVFLEKTDAFLKNPSVARLNAVVSLLPATNLENQQARVDALNSDRSFEEKQTIVSELFTELNDYLSTEVFNGFQPA